MTLHPGERLGPFELVELCGKGGMGEVYLAQDTRLDREVAIKVLPARFTDNQAFRQRFEREAKTISQLQHPNVCTLHDVGSEDGVSYLVMEYLNGETLGDRLKKGGLPTEQAIRVGTEIAEAIHAAHRRGIVHRDLKPGNVMLTDTGAKVLDFGLARELIENESELRSGDATLAAPITQEGRIVGTMPYMAPEQLKAEDADSRTDIWALGCILYEMLSGQRPFRGDSQADLVASILSDQPEFPSRDGALVPDRLDWVVKRCLEKDPERRWQSARDIAIELDGVLAERPAEPAEAATEWRGSRLAMAGIALLALGALLGWLASVTFMAEPPAKSTTQLQRLSINLPVDRPLVRASQQWGNRTLNLSPDGSVLAYISPRRESDISSGDLVVHRIDGLDFQQTSARDASSPFFSPDGEWLVFGSDGFEGQLNKVRVSGGDPTPIMPLTTPVTVNFFGGAWCDDDFIYLALFDKGLHRLPSGGGAPVRLDVGEGTIGSPRCLPGSKGLLITRKPAGIHAARSVQVIDLETLEAKLLVEEAEEAQYVATGHLLYSRAGALMATPFDLATLSLAGPAENVTPHGLSTVPIPYQWSVGDNGTLVYSTSPVVPSVLHAVLVNRQTREVTRLDLPPTPANQPAALSPDGQFVVSSSMVPSGWIHLQTLQLQAGAQARQLGIDGGFIPVVTPDGDDVIFVYAKPGQQMNLARRGTDGNRSMERLTTSDFAQYPVSVSPDGETLFFAQRNESTRQDILSLSLLDPSLPPTTVLGGLELEDWGSLSPNGAWFLYNSTSGQESKLLVRSWPDLGTPQLVASGPYPCATWSPKGDEIFFWSPEGIMVMDVVTTSTTFSRGEPHLLLPGSFELPTLGVSPDAQTFLLIQGDQGEPTTEIRVINHWLTELEHPD